MTGGQDADRLGELVGGKYRVTRLLARGGMGVVYEAQHAVVHRRFAIKFLRRDLAERRDILARFQREAETAGALENENVTAAIDFGVSRDGAPYIVMEYLVGESLANLLLRVGRLPLARAADLVAQACRGVAAAHAAGIVHRDLKPHNLFVGRRDDGTDLVKVLDFGVAKLQAIEDAGSETRTGTVLGTAAYMAPEQARGETLIDQRADVYALGAVLYELVSLKRPHPGDSQNAILHHIATQPAVPLGAVQSDLPTALVGLVERTLASDPAARPVSAEAMARELAPFARREVWPAGPDDRGLARAAPGPAVGSDLGARSVPDVVPNAAASGEDAPGPVPTTAAPAARAPVGWILGGSLLVLVLVAGWVVGRARSAGGPAAGGDRVEVAPSSATAPKVSPSPTTAVAMPALKAEPSAADTAQADPPPIATPSPSMAVGSGGRPGAGAHKRTFAGRPARQPSETSLSNPPPASSPPVARPGLGDRTLLGPAFDSANPYK